MPDAHISACLQKNWNVFALLIGLIRRLVQSASFTRQTKHRACHLLRMAEAFARRLLVLRAHTLTLTEEAARKPKRAESASLQTPPTNARSACASLSLAEPLPAFIPLSDTPFPEADPAQATEANLDDPANPAPATRRLAVLEDILLRPAHHARRMARWLKRFAARTRRFTPFCLGSPPGTSRRPKDKGLDRQLRDTDFFARRALSLAPG